MTKKGIIEGTGRGIEVIGMTGEIEGKEIERGIEVIEKGTEEIGMIDETEEVIEIEIETGTEEVIEKGIERRTEIGIGEIATVEEVVQGPLDVS